MRLAVAASRGARCFAQEPPYLGFFYPLTLGSFALVHSGGTADDLAAVWEGNGYYVLVDVTSS